ncbi:molybdopterin-dependent oxidoreductase [Kineosporia babensis]|uniref:Molybdopterin-dependent oxidoreductase n=1 Tax=Kineosporia babensis TaxID=499548 RepID=A0A9X1SVT4_9ACTN|nr:molybdopterin-dependent oxidoreductase [Kineosporia babensis]
MSRTVLRGCPLCEAMCGLSVTLGPDEEVLSVRGDPDDVYSQGFLCPKGASLGAVDDDPDRLTAPLVRHGEAFEEVSWDEAFAAVRDLLTPLLSSDRNTVAAYTGNPTGHNVAFSLLATRLARSLGSIQNYSPATMDQLPQNVAAAMLFGEPSSIPVPDLANTDLLVVIGANPLVSNGSIGAAPDYRGHLKALRRRKGRLVVIDPVATATAAVADQHLAVRPGTDLFLLLAVLQVLTTLNVTPERTTGLAELSTAVAAWTPEVSSGICGVEASLIENLARDLLQTERAAVYGRLGTTLNQHGTLTCWALQAVNVLAGNLDRPGGMLFPRPVSGGPTTRAPRGPAEPFTVGRYRTRVSGHPEVLGEFPVAALAEEILTPGPGRVRGLITYAGNPARSFPDSARIQTALAHLDALICVDPYLNETTRHAHVILPPPGLLTRDHFDMALLPMGQRNFARFSEPARALPENALSEWEILLRLCAIYEGRSITSAELETELAQALSKSIARFSEAQPHSEQPSGPRQLLDLRIRSGPYGDQFGHRPDGLTLAKILDAPHGIDLGALQPRLNEVVRTPSGTIELTPPTILATLEPPEPGRLVLVGRRDLRSKNSWLHNVSPLAKGKDRSTLHLSPEDASAHGIENGTDAVLTSAAGQIRVPVTITDEVPPGVCSLGHGWGHDDPHARLRVAARKPGVNSNTLTDATVLDPLSGTVQMNGIPVTIRPVSARAEG